MGFSPDIILGLGGPIFVGLAVWFLFFHPARDLDETVDTYEDREWLRREGYFTNNDTG